MDGNDDGIGVNDRKASEAYVAALKQWDEGRVDETVRRLRRARMERGPCASTRAWLDKPLDLWLERLRQGRVDLDEETMGALAVGMNEILSIRDVMILSMLHGEERCDRETLMRLSSRPRLDSSRALVRELLVEAYRDEDGPDLDRCQSGVTMLVAMSRIMPPRMRVQQHATLGYMLWWMGDSRAPLYALRALADDRRCVLAALVLGACEDGMCPASVERETETGEEECDVCSGRT